MKPEPDTATRTREAALDMPIDVIVTLRPKAQLDLDHVLSNLSAAGLIVTEVLDPLGAVTGSIAGDRIGELLLVDGVSNVSRSETFELPPPDSDLQ
jgi:hypothetical protein